MKRKIHILGSGHAANKHREAIERFPEVYTITGYEEADIVDICTKNYRHCALATKILIDRKDVILEKPFAREVTGLRTLLGFSKQCGKRVYPVLNYRELKVSNQALIWRRDTEYYSGWRGDICQAWGGVIMSHGIHFIDNAIYNYGLVKSVFCMTDTHPAYDVDVETEALIVLQFSTGYTRPIRLTISPKLPQNAPDNPGWDDFFADLDRAPELSTLVHLQKVIDACYQSAASSNMVTLS